MLWGDKDTFGIAFAVAGKAHLFSQVAVPPCEWLFPGPDMIVTLKDGVDDWATDKYI